MKQTFNTPDELWRYCLALAEKMRNDGHIDQAKQLEFYTRLPCTTGSEWLGELSLAVKNIMRAQCYSKEINDSLNNVLKTTKSKSPYV